MRRELKSLQMGKITVVSVPPGARIYYDGVDTGINASATISNVIPNVPHNVSLVLSGYQYYIESATIYPGQESRIVGGALTPITPPAGFGNLTVTSTPLNGAEFRMPTGEMGTTPVIGITPATLYDIPAGINIYESGILVGYSGALAGYTGALGSAIIRAGETTNFNIPLRLFDPNMGIVFIESIPMEANIFIDGSPIGAYTTLGILMSPGIHTYELRLFGYKPAIGEFTVVAGAGQFAAPTVVSVILELETINVCTSITTPTATPSTVTIGDTVTLTATAQPTTSIFSVAFKDQNNIVLGTANTISGVATLQWNTAGKAAGTYNIKAHVGTQCSSQTARAVTLNTPGACTITMIEADTYTAITGSTITLTTIIDPPGIYDVNLKVDGVTINTASITTDSSGMATLPFVTTGQPPGLHNLRVEVIGPSPMSCESGVDVALTTTTAACAGITIDTPGPITVYVGDLLSIPVTATGVTEQSVIEFRDTASGQGGTLCTISPPGGQCTFSGSVPVGTPSGTYHMVASIGNGPFLKCASDPIELIVLQSASACTSITVPTATPTSVTIGDTVTLAATVQPTTSIFSVSFKDQNNNVLGTANTVSGVATIQWNTAGKAAGTYNIKARVGTQCSSPTRAVTINIPTCTSITVPTATLTTVTIGGTVTLTATAQPTTSIFTVSFKDQNNNVLGTANTVGGVATIQWNTAGKTAETYNIKAYVGTQCSSLTAVTVTLDMPTTACTSITAPTATPTIVTIGEVVNLSATAEPTTATFTVDFKDQNNNVIGSENTSSGIASYVWNTGGVSAGTYNIKAYVGAQCGSSEPVTVTVNQTTVACISVTTPLAMPSSVTIGELVALRATVQPTTSIFTVDFKDQDNNVIGSANTLDGVAAYNWNTTGKIAKIYQINAYAGTCVSPTAVAVTLSTAPGAGGGIGMLVGLVGVAALGMMMFKPKPK